LELAGLGVKTRVVATDLALAPWGLLQRQRRVQPDELHPTLAEADARLFKSRFPRRLAFSPSLYRELRRTVAAYDLVHIHNLWQFPQYGAQRVALEEGVPYIVSPHGGLDPFLRQRGRVRKGITTALWQQRMLSKARLIHVMTDAEERLIADIAPEVPRAVVPCGIYVDEFAKLPPGDLFRRTQLNGYGGPVILFLGRITQKKGVDVLIRAFSLVRQAQKCRLVIAGPDDEGLLPQLKQLVDELRLGAEVSFIDAIYGEKRLAALASADVWALSSHTENFGIAVIEASAAGRAVVISPGVNLSSQIGEAGVGLVADAEPNSFASALLRVLTDDACRQGLEQNSRAFAARYDWSVVAPQLLDMYRTATLDSSGG
jgi:glycosyltransferase involved in cell wall biosynthesis